MEVDYDLVLDKISIDPHNYSAVFREVRVLWYEPGNNDPAGETVIWDGTGDSPFTKTETGYKYKGSIAITPPTPTTNRFALRFTARIYGNDSFDQEDGFERIHTTEKFNLPAGS